MRIRGFAWTVMISLLLAMGSQSAARAEQLSHFNAAAQKRTELIQDICFLFIEAQIEKALAGFYDLPVLYARDNVEIQKIQRPNGPGTYSFRIGLTVKKYIGPNNQIGIDTITLETNEDGLHVVQYAHEQSFDYDHLIARESVPHAGRPHWSQEDDPGIYEAVMMRLLQPSIDKAIGDHHGVPYAHDPWSNRILQLRQMKPNQYYMILDVQPYTGAHNTVSLDRVVLTIESGPSVKIRRCLTIKDYTKSISYLPKFLSRLF